MISLLAVLAFAKRGGALITKSARANAMESPSNKRKRVTFSLDTKLSDGSPATVKAPRHQHARRSACRVIEDDDDEPVRQPVVGSPTSTLDHVLTAAEATALRAFDLDMQFGPLVGMTRLARWERAHKFCLDPPRAVKAMLVRLPPTHLGMKSIWQGHMPAVF